jgi:hypothetical protein
MEVIFMHQWTEPQALRALNGNVSAHNKMISCNGGFYGLQACSAYDYLCDHCGYQIGKMEVIPESKELFDH